MDNLKCNRLTCRRALAEKAVVTTCSHIFCVDCANELFNASRLCPACETSLTEPDDVVVCSLHPSNDYKTSVLSGLSPTIILEICSRSYRAMSFWQYQMHQEFSFQHAVYRNMNEKNAQLQKQLDNVIREANGEITLLNNKVSDLQRDLELERRRSAGLQDSLKERDNEYQKLKTQYDKIKRKALLAPTVSGAENAVSLPVGDGRLGDRNALNDQSNKVKAGMFLGSNTASNGPVNVGAVVNDMEANGIQRTPIATRTMAMQGIQPSPVWRQPGGGVAPTRLAPQRQPFNANTLAASTDRSFRTNTTRSDQSDSAGEVERLIGGRQTQSVSAVQRASPWEGRQPHGGRIPSRVFAQPNVPGSVRRSSGSKFRPAPVT